MSFMYFLNILTLHLCLVPNIIFASDFSAKSRPLPGAERWPGRSAKLPPNPGLVEEWNTWDSWDLQSDFEFISSRVHYDIVSESYPCSIQHNSTMGTPGLRVSSESLQLSDSAACKGKGVQECLTRMRETEAKWRRMFFFVEDNVQGRFGHIFVLR